MLLNLSVRAAVGVDMYGCSHTVFVLVQRDRLSTTFTSAWKKRKRDGNQAGDDNFSGHAILLLVMVTMIMIAMRRDFHLRRSEP